LDRGILRVFAFLDRLRAAAGCPPLPDISV
jgi:hypothetical protein